VRGLQVVDGLPHVALRGEEDRLQPIVRLVDPLGLADLEQPHQQLLVAAEQKIAQGWPQSRGKLRPLIGILSQNARPSRANSANRVKIT
jgi:hypothetical protein